MTNGAKPDRADVCIIGAGASGAAAAKVLTERGLRVVMLERGPWRTRETFGGVELANVALDGRRGDMGAGPDDPRRPRQQQHPVARQPDRRPRRRHVRQRLEPHRRGHADRRVQRSTDKGATWSEPIAVDVLLSSAVTTQGGVVDPSDGHPVRTGDLIPDAAADPLYVVWQDLRFPLLEPIANDQIVVASSRDGGLTWTDPGAPAPTAASSRSRDRCTSTATARSASRTTTSPTTTRAAGRSTPTRGSPPHRAAD